MSDGHKRKDAYNHEMNLSLKFIEIFPK